MVLAEYGLLEFCGAAVLVVLGAAVGWLGGRRERRRARAEEMVAGSLDHIKCRYSATRTQSASLFVVNVSNIGEKPIYGLRVDVRLPLTKAQFTPTDGSEPRVLESATAMNVNLLRMDEDCPVFPGDAADFGVPLSVVPLHHCSDMQFDVVVSSKRGQIIAISDENMREVLCSGASGEGHRGPGCRGTERMKCRMYVDEVGNSDMGSSDNPNHRFLSLTGVIIDLGYVAATVQPELEAMKAQFFQSHPDDPVVFHRKEILNRLYPFEALRDAGVREAFDKALLGRFREWDCRVITVCIDKKGHRDRYQKWRYDPYHYCLAVLLERFVFFLNRQGAKGDVLAESRGGRADRRLKDSFTRLWEQGTQYLDEVQVQGALTSKQLKVKTKANNIAGLQIADLIAHPSREEILEEHGLRAKPLAPFAQRIVAVLATKYDQRGGTTFGKKLL